MDVAATNVRKTVANQEVNQLTVTQISKRENVCAHRRFNSSALVHLLHAYFGRFSFVVYYEFAKKRMEALCY